MHFVATDILPSLTTQFIAPLPLTDYQGLWSEYILLEPAEPDPFPYTCRWQFEPKSHAESIGACCK